MRGGSRLLRRRVASKTDIHYCGIAGIFGNEITLHLTMAGYKTLLILRIGRRTTCTFIHSKILVFELLRVRSVMSSRWEQ